MAGDSARFVVELLGAGHDRKGFDCGVEALNDYLKTQARQDAERGVSTAYVLVASETRAVAGFYMLSASAVRLGDWPESVAKRLPRYPFVPVTLLGRLAVDRAYRGQRVGEQLLLDALARSVHASRTVASVAIIVDAKDADGVRFYERYGFKAFPEHPLRLFLPMKTVKLSMALRSRSRGS